MNKILVETKSEECLPFKKNRIVKSLMDEIPDMKESEAVKIARSVKYQLEEAGISKVSTGQIRELVFGQLIKRGKEQEAKDYEKLGLGEHEIQKMIEEPDVTENANLRYAPASIEKHISDAVLQQYTFKRLPSELSRLHLSGDIYIHDGSYFFLRSLNCIQMDIRPFIKNGFVAGGDPISNIVSKPPKHMDTLVNIMGEACLSAQQQLSGGISLACLNTFMAPFAEGLSDEELKQNIQMYLFNLASAYQSRGQQPIFQSVNLDMAVPEIFIDEPAIGPNGVSKHVYGDYFDEARKITQGFVEVLGEGDALGRPFLFPNTIFHLRREFLNDKDFEEDFLNVHKLSAKDGTPYFVPYEKGLKLRTQMGCRTALDDSFTGSIDSAMRTGNLHYCTINLPRLAIKSKGNDDLLFEGLRELMDKIREILMIRRDSAEKYLDMGLYKFLSQDVGDGPYYKLENSSLSYAIVGLNETLLTHTGNGILDKESDKFGVKIVEEMNNIANEYKEEDGLRHSVFAAPAESASGRLCEKDLKLFGNNIPYNGPKSAPFYSNSTHTPVDENIDIFEKIEIESKYHPMLPAGQILNLFMDEGALDHYALNKLTNKIVTKTDTRYFCYSPQYTFCMKCQKQFFGLYDKCPNCGIDSSNLIERARITGYYATVNRHDLQKNRGSGFNKNKVSELLRRKHFQGV